MASRAFVNASSLRDINGTIIDNVRLGMSVAELYREDAFSV